MLTRRGKIVAAIAAALVIAAIWWIAGNVWITQEGRICIGSMMECV